MSYLKNPEYQKRIKELNKKLDNKEISWNEYKREADKLMEKYG